MKISFRLALFMAFATFGSTAAHAMDLDWSGQFRAEAVMLNNFAPESNLASVTPPAVGGYQVVAPGTKSARFQTLFARLRPNLIVNDNVAIKSEWWLGNPITGFYGVDYPGASRADQRYYNSTFSGGSTISAQRIWAEFLTDLGTFQVGRAPLHWGLGAVYNSGDGVFDRYQSTGDMFRMVSKFGNFSLIPAHVKYSMGNAVGGTCVGTACDHPTGGQGISDYMLGLRYENKDEDFEGGVNFVRRIVNSQNEAILINGNAGPGGARASTVGGANFTIWDIYGRKRIGKFDFGIEAPIFNGSMLGIQYKAFALATELKYRANDSWNFWSKFGKVPGQPNAVGTIPNKWSMVYLHPSYKLGLIMFNYNFRNFAGPNNPNVSTTSGNVLSIYDNPITNANYLALGTTLTADKWRFNFSFITAKANEAASAGENFFNTWDRAYSTAAAVKNQDNSLGTEFDLGIALDWDEFTTFGLDTGMYFPGGFYEFENAATDNDLKTVLGIVGSIGVRF
jgi:hypothetical protein